MDSGEKYRRHIGLWRCGAVLFGVAFVVTLIALIAIVVKNAKDDNDGKASGYVISCPELKGGLQTSGDPDNPSPFHDLTMAEYQRLYDFLRKEPRINLPPVDKLMMNTSSVFMVDLLLPAKQQVLMFLDNKGQQPEREARVMVFRGDKSPPLVEEYRVGPLSNPSYAQLLNNPQRQNPVPFAVRPIGAIEYEAVFNKFAPMLDQQIGHILTESYGGKFTDCGNTCLTVFPTPVGTGLIGQMKRKVWLWGNYPAEYLSLYPLDFSVLLNLDGSDKDKWSVEKIWYSGALYNSVEELVDKYSNDDTISKTRISYVHNSKKLKSTQNLRGDPTPHDPQRPPLQVEPDGKRYTIEHRHIKYLGWDLDIRLSAFTGPQMYDIRYKGERIAYELGLSEISVFYSGDNPTQRVTNYVDSGVLIGTHSKSLISGADCPESATFLNVSFLGEGMSEATTLERAICVFEQNMGVPLRRHLSYARSQGSFYGGMPDSALIIRSILTIVNYDYLVDFIFHQNAAVETRLISTGYILSTFYRPEEMPYGFRLDEHITANIHHHMFHVKADLDVGGLSNRYETLDISNEEVTLNQISPTAKYRQTKFQRHLRTTEQDAVYKFNFETPKYHIVHNDQKRTEFDAPRAYRIHLDGMSKQLLPEGFDNEVTIPWARQQLAVTVQKNEESVSSSPYAMFDSLNPVTNFSNFISDEKIVDKDLVFWITMGTHHIPHTEDIPVTPTVGGHLSFFLLPYNYFPECPSVSSRDNIRVDYVTPNKPEDGLHVDRNGNKKDGVCGALTMEQLVRQRPDDILQTNNDFKLL